MNITAGGPPFLILMYHAVVAESLAFDDWCFLNESSFREQISLLERTCQPVKLSAALRGEFDPAGGLPVAVTFDDGFHNNYTVAFPILNELRVPGTIFVSTAFVESRDCLWFCKLHRAIARTRLDTLHWAGRRYDLSSMAACRLSSAQLQAWLKTLVPGRLENEVRLLAAALGDDADQPVRDDSPYGMLTSAAIRDMVYSGSIEFGAHTHTHAILSMIPPAMKDAEILTSIDLLREITGRDTRLFAYPNGRTQDYDANCLDTLRKAGIVAAVTAVEGLNDAHTQRLELRRVGIGSDTTLTAFEGMLREYGAAWEAAASVGSGR